MYDIKNIDSVMRIIEESNDPDIFNKLYNTNRMFKFTTKFILKHIDKIDSKFIFNKLILNQYELLDLIENNIIPLYTVDYMYPKVRIDFNIYKRHIYDKGLNSIEDVYVAMKYIKMPNSFILEYSNVVDNIIRKFQNIDELILDNIDKFPHIDKSVFVEEKYVTEDISEAVNLLIDNDNVLYYFEHSPEELVTSFENYCLYGIYKSVHIYGVEDRFDDCKAVIIDGEGICYYEPDELYEYLVEAEYVEDDVKYCTLSLWDKWDWLEMKMPDTYTFTYYREMEVMFDVAFSFEEAREMASKSDRYTYSRIEKMSRKKDDMQKLMEYLTTNRITYY